MIVSTGVLWVGRRHQLQCYAQHAHCSLARHQNVAPHVRPTVHMDGAIVSQVFFPHHKHLHQLGRTAAASQQVTRAVTGTSARKCGKFMFGEKKQKTDLNKVALGLGVGK